LRNFIVHSPECEPDVVQTRPAMVVDRPGATLRARADRRVKGV
jgi:hypothetical protein